MNNKKISTNNTVFIRNYVLPNNIFNPKIKYFLAFEPSFVSDEPFFPCLSLFSRELDGDSLIGIDVLDGDDSKSTETIFKIANKIEFRGDWDHFINSRCLCSHYRIIGIYSESQSWGIYVDDIDFEIGLVGFENEDQMNLFLEIFMPELDVFESVKDYVEELDSILSFSPKTRRLYNEMVNSYSFKV